MGVFGKQSTVKRVHLVPNYHCISPEGPQLSVFPLEPPVSK